MEIDSRELRQLAAGRRRAAPRRDEDVPRRDRASTTEPTSTGTAELRHQAGVGGAALALGSAFLPGGLLTPADAQGITDEDLAAFAAVGRARPPWRSTAGRRRTEHAPTKPVAKLFMQHHQQHADAFGAVARVQGRQRPQRQAGRGATPALQAVKDEKGALELAFGLENQAAETYAFGLTVAAGMAAIGGMATILPIEAEHAAILGVALGKSLADIFVNGAFESAAVGDGTRHQEGHRPAPVPGRLTPGTDDASQWTPRGTREDDT